MPGHPEPLIKECQMARKLKVYGGNTRCHGKQVRFICAISSKKKLAEISGISLHYLNGYCCETGNALEIRTAMANPEKLMVCDINGQYNDDVKYYSFEDYENHLKIIDSAKKIADKTVYGQATIIQGEETINSILTENNLKNNSQSV
jgi:hypothetical protein